jgi:hypothetical protein
MHVILETPRLILRQFTGNDVDNLFDLNSDPEVTRYLTAGKQTPREVIRDEIIPFHLGVYKRLDRLGTWAAESTANGRVPGLVTSPRRPAHRHHQRRPRLPAATIHVEHGLRHGRVARPDQHGVHQHVRRAGVRAHDDR